MTSVESRRGKKVPVEVPTPPRPVTVSTPPESDDLAEDLNALERKERQEQQRLEQERLAKLRELARFD